MTPAALPTIGEVVDCRAEPTDDRLFSVTTIIGVLDKPALVHWAANEVAKQVVRKLPQIQRRLDDDGPDETARYIARMRFDTDGLLKASDLGTLAHHLFNIYALTGTRPDVHPELHPDHAKDGSVLDPRDLFTLGRMLDQFDAFLTQFQPDYECTEVVVYHPKMGYAGQCDAIARIARVPLIIDYKTSRDTYTKAGKLKGPYPEVGLQLAAYRHATHAAVWRARRYESAGRRYYLLNDVERAAALPVPEVVDGAAIYITPESFGVYPVQCDAPQWRAFLFAQEVARWSFNVAQHVVGNPMIPPLPPAALIDAGDPFQGLPTD